MTITKAEMATRICEKARVSKDDAFSLVEGTFDFIKASLERGEPVKISRFGTFLVRTKRQRRGRNPQTGGEIIISGRQVVTFKPSLIIIRLFRGADLPRESGTSL